MEAPAPAPWPALGVLLIRDGLVTRAELEAALAEQGDARDRRVSGKRLGEALVEKGVVTTAQVARLVAEQHELPFVDLDESDSMGPVTTRLPEELAIRCSALPIRLFPDGSLLVAVADPARVECLEDIRRTLGVRVRWAVAAPDAIAAAIEVAQETALRQAEEAAEAVEAAVADDGDGDSALELAPPIDATASSYASETPHGERRPVLGSLLLRDGLVTEDELDAALAQQRLSNTRRLGEILVARGALSEAEISRALAEQHELPFVDLQEHDIDMDAAALLPLELARRHSALPVSYLPDGSVLVVVADPTSAIHDDALRAEMGVPVQYAVATLLEIDALITSASVVDQPQELADDEPLADGDAKEAASAEIELPARPSFTLVPALEAPGAQNGDGDGDGEGGDRGEHENEAETAPGVLATIEHALSLGASAIHFAPRTTGMVVLGRVDEELRELAILHDRDRATIELGGLLGVNITHATRAHRARSLCVVFGESESVLQAAVLPTTRGTRVTLRVVDDVTVSPSLSDLITDESQRGAILDALTARRGLLVFCGTPASGQTTMFYAALQAFDPSERSVLTVEDPVEVQIDGIDQIEVDMATGVTAASGLRAILDSDPDVVAVGALADVETARAALNGALDTLVLTTLVAPTASAGVRRLSELVGDAGPLGAALTGVVAQQVVRETCLACRETYYATADELFELRLPSEESGRRLLGRGRGCDECGDSGYQGQTTLIEVLPLTDEVRALVAHGSSAAEIEHAAGAAGMRTLREQGIALCLEGLITTAELRAVADRPRRRWHS